jgi:hypothetical protein
VFCRNGEAGTKKAVLNASQEMVDISGHIRVKNVLISYFPERPFSRQYFAHSHYSKSIANRLWWSHLASGPVEVSFV